MQYYFAKLKALRSYNLSLFKGDLMAGLIVSLVALPLAMSFSIAIGLKPEYGLYAAVVGGILAALFGGSEVNVTGPTGAFIAVLAGIVINFGFEKLLIAGFLAGVILLLAGLFRMGRVIEYIPYPVIIGFTAGIAIIIFTSQLGNLFGIQGMARHEFFHENIGEFLGRIGDMNLAALLVATMSVLIVVYAPKINNKIPGALAAVTVAGMAVYFFNIDTPTIKSIYGGIPRSLPSIHGFDISFGLIKELFPAAFSIAVLGAIESLLSCVVSDGMCGKKHNSDRELVGQGIANMVVPFFGGIPVTGALARTVVNVKTGANTRLAAIFHGIFILLIMLVFAPLVAYVPLAALGGILAVVSYRMAEIEHAVKLFKRSGRNDKLVFLATFLLTVFIDITVSISIGLGLAAFLFVKRMSEFGPVATKIDREGIEPSFTPSEEQLNCEHLTIYTIEGPLFFGAARRALAVMSEVGQARALLIRLKHVPVIDYTGYNALIGIINIHKNNKMVYLSGANDYLMKRFEKFGLFEMIDRKNIFVNSRDAINQAMIDQGLPEGCEDYKVIK